MKPIILIISILCCGIAIAQSPRQLYKSAEELYENGAYADAEIAYRKALEKESSVKGNYNLGNTVYQQQRFEEAVDFYNKSATRATDPTVKANAYHNLGNAYFNQQQYKESVEAYKKALRANPTDPDTKKNLSIATQQLRMQQQQQQQQNQQQQNEQDKQDQQQQDQNQEQQQNEQNQSEQNQEQQNQNQQQQQQQQQQSPDESQTGEGAEPVQERGLTEEEARELLEIIQSEEQKALQKYREAKGKRRKTDKDW